MENGSTDNVGSNSGLQMEGLGLEAACFLHSVNLINGNYMLNLLLAFLTIYCFSITSPQNTDSVEDSQI